MFSSSQNAVYLFISNEVNAPHRISLQQACYIAYYLPRAPEILIAARWLWNQRHCCCCCCCCCCSSYSTLTQRFIYLHLCYSCHWRS